MSRQGLNCTLAYMAGARRRAYQVRANVLTHGMKVIYDESQARVRKAFYPHRLSSAQFFINIELVGHAEHRSLVNWMAEYADYILDPKLRFGEFPSMAVSIPSRNFLRKGVPLSGFQWEDVVGKMVWNAGIVFETAGEPGENAPDLSRAVGTITGAETRYFYPTGIQLSGDSTPPDGTYATSISLRDVLPPAQSGTRPSGGRSTAGGLLRD